MARHRGKKPANTKPLGMEGTRVRNQIITGHTMEVKRLEVELTKTTNPVQKKLLARQIRKEKGALARFIQQTK